MEAMRKGGALGQCFAVFAPWKKLKESPYERYKKEVASYRRMLGAYAPLLRSAFKVEDVEENERAGAISAVLTVEGGDFLQGELSRIKKAKEDGVRMITLTWNTPNELGWPQCSDPALSALPLREFGRLAVEEMQREGILVDLSHLNRGGFWDAARLCQKPFVCSHSCADALCSHSRNLTDDQLRLLGERGGVVGLNFYSRFLKKDSVFTRMEDLISHARHIVRVAGEDALGLGSDFDGRDTPISFGGWEGMQALAEALLQCFSYGQVEKICYGNAMRVWREALS